MNNKTRIFTPVWRQLLTAAAQGKAIVLENIQPEQVTYYRKEISKEKCRERREEFEQVIEFFKLRYTYNPVERELHVSLVPKTGPGSLSTIFLRKAL